MNQELLELLVCPRCHGALSVFSGAGEELAGLDCPSCRLRFPVQEGIPIMLLEEAVPLDGEELQAPPAPK